MFLKFLNFNLRKIENYLLSLYLNLVYMVSKLNHLFQFLVIIFFTFSCSKTDIITINLNNTIQIDSNDTKDSIILKAAHVVPTKNQYKALKDEFIAFIHFGPNTFTRMEWGSGKEDPFIFDLKKLNTDQWCEAIKSAGMTKVIFTAKHHDGFCLWQTRYTNHGVMSTNFKKGNGDILKELAASCEKYGLKLGVYLSPADLFQIENKNGLYGNKSKHTERIIPRKVQERPFKNKTTFKFKVDDYNEYFLNQLFELLTEYGEIQEVWFDGAHPKRKGNQQYNYTAWKELIQTLAPQAVIFGKQDVRWCGNEAGKTRKTEWNIIPYQEDPKLLKKFPDLTAESIGSRKELLNGKFLHYQYAEINTSIREGWFYRDEHNQKVRSADDVFDMYERSIGGNTVFLLNIPPNRDGEFSSKDVEVLKEVGNRIKETYSQNLFSKAKAPQEILDNNHNSYKLLKNGNNSITIATPELVTINRFVIQEAIQTHSERIEEHALDVWLEGAWKEIYTSTNVGYKRILRFPEVTSNKFRLRILKSRLNPAISKIAAHYYKSRPQQLEITRDAKGMVKIDVQKSKFNWKPHGENVSRNLTNKIEIRYTIDESIPSEKSNLYNKPFFLKDGNVKAAAFDNNQMGSVSSNLFGILNKDWKVLSVDSEYLDYKSTKAFDGNINTYWMSSKGSSHYLAIDLGKVYKINGFEYVPQIENARGMIEKGVIQTSSDGKSWQFVESFEFGNLINDPTKRRHYFKNNVRTRFIRIVTKRIASDGKVASIAELNFI